MSPGEQSLVETTDFGSNPGALGMWSFVPDTMQPGAPLVVVLHGCTQTASSYDQGAGWSTLARRHGFAVLYPEQQRANNPNLCFNWFQPTDVARVGGEAESIRQMIARMVRDHAIDPARITVTGLSAGGAMTASMLAAYPEVFAGGAIIAGLPHGAATSVPGAFEAMFQGTVQTPRHWGDLVRAASSHRGPWPGVQIWQGSGDTTVKPVNAIELAKQWSDVMGLSSNPTARDQVDETEHASWRNDAGETVLETYLVPGMGHGTPLSTQSADVDRRVGKAGPHMLEAGIGSSYHIARSWGLLTAAPETACVPERTARIPRIPLPKLNLPTLGLPALGLPGGPGAVIEKALRAAGLLRS